MTNIKAVGVTITGTLATSWILWVSHGVSSVSAMQDTAKIEKAASAETINMRFDNLETMLLSATAGLDKRLDRLESKQDAIYKAAATFPFTPQANLQED